MNSYEGSVMSKLSHMPPFLKLLSKLRNVVAAVPDYDGPRRSWDSAAAREIQLELDLETGQPWYTMTPVSVKEAATFHGRLRHGKHPTN